MMAMRRGVACLWPGLSTGIEGPCRVPPYDASCLRALGRMPP